MLNETFVYDISFAEELEKHYALAGPYMERLLGNIPSIKCRPTKMTLSLSGSRLRQYIAANRPATLLRAASEES